MYIPGNYWMICDRCGTRFRRSQMKEEWTGLWVCKRYCWTVRHPQDFVTSIPDDPSVPVSRPDVQQTMGETTLALVAIAGDTVIKLTSSSGLAEKDSIGIVMDDNSVHWTFIYELPSESGVVVFQGQAVTFAGDTEILMGGQTASYTLLGSYLPSSAASGNVVYLPSINNESWI